MKEEVDSLPDHVVYRPRDLAAMGEKKLGVVAWGNGGCSDDGASSRFHLLELASHGYLVIANGRIYSGPGAHQQPESPEPADGELPPPHTTEKQLLEAIDWALAENERRGSPYHGLIDSGQIAVAGFSCGGLQALAVADDPRLDTMVLMNTGIINEGSSWSIRWIPWNSKWGCWARCRVTSQFEIIDRCHSAPVLGCPRVLFNCGQESDGKRSENLRNAAANPVLAAAGARVWAGCLRCC